MRPGDTARPAAQAGSAGNRRSRGMRATGRVTRPADVRQARAARSGDTASRTARATALGPGADRSAACRSGHDGSGGEPGVHARRRPRRRATSSLAARVHAPLRARLGLARQRPAVLRPPRHGTAVLAGRSLDTLPLPRHARAVPAGTAHTWSTHTRTVNSRTAGARTGRGLAGHGLALLGLAGLRLARNGLTVLAGRNRSDRHGTGAWAAGARLPAAPAGCPLRTAAAAPGDPAGDVARTRHYAGRAVGHGAGPTRHRRRPNALAPRHDGRHDRCRGPRGLSRAGRSHCPGAEAATRIGTVAAGHTGAARPVRSGSRHRIALP